MTARGGCTCAMAADEIERLMKERDSLSERVAELERAQSNMFLSLRNRTNEHLAAEAALAASEAEVAKLREAMTEACRDARSTVSFMCGALEQAFVTAREFLARNAHRSNKEGA